MPNVDFSREYMHAFISVITNLYVLLWLFCYAVSVLLWMYILSKVEVSYAYPFLSIGFILVMLIGIIGMGESVNIYKIIGMLSIVFGVILIYKFS